MLRILSFAAITALCGCASDTSNAIKLSAGSSYSYQPENGCVSDAATARKIADAILIPIYGKKEVEWNKPFSAVLEKGIWTVGGTGNHPGIEGGGMLIEISKNDGQIRRIYAGQ